MKLPILFLSFCVSLSAMADDFKVKLDVSLINAESCAGVNVVVKEKGAEVMSEILEADGETKLKLEEGKLFEIWISKDGYLPHVIHNVHNEGKTKFDVMLYKPTKKVSYSKTDFSGVNRFFVDVKKMTIPAEYLASGVLVVNEDDLSKNEVVNLKAVSKVAKSQEKAQKKIDKYAKSRSKLEDKISDVKAEVASGETSQMEGDEEVLKLQKAVVKINDKLKKLAY